MENNYPKLHNAMWPGVVGKGSGDGEPFIPQQSVMNFPEEMRKVGFTVARDFSPVRAGKPFTFPTLVATKTA